VRGDATHCNVNSSLERSTRIDFGLKVVLADTPILHEALSVSTNSLVNIFDDLVVPDALEFDGEV
jgi:hypothetical protein